MPGLDGYGVLSHLRSRPATADIPVIVLTAKGDEDNEVRVFELGADDFLTKSFRARALSARLEAVLRRRRHSPPADDALSAPRRHDAHRRVIRRRRPRSEQARGSRPHRLR